MTDNGLSVFVDDQVAAQILAVIKEARQFATIVTPYLKLQGWGHACNAIESAAKKGVKLTFVLRADSDNSPDDIGLLQSKSAKVLFVPGLHAKIYLNEHSILVSSMNLHEHSAQNSLEIALAVPPGPAEKQLRDYAADIIRKHGAGVGYRAEDPVPQRVKESRGRGYAASGGSCIRCGRRIAADPYHPLCNDCYDDWAQWSNPDYPERFCHSCGRPARVDYGRPLCDACYRTS